MRAAAYVRIVAAMDEHVELGVLIPIGQAQWGPGADPRSLTGFAVRAEELGYSSLWVNDFLLTPRIEALTMLAAVAPLTQRVTLGTSALLPVLRRPVQAAQTLASIDRLSGGRLVLTVGAAFPGRFGVPQHALSEVPWERRFTRLDETVALWRQLWASPSGGGSFHGSLLRFGDLPPTIAPSRAGGPPVWLGGASESALRRIGRMYDGWMPYPPAAAQYAEGLAAVRTDGGRGRAQRGRGDTRTIRVSGRDRLGRASDTRNWRNSLRQVTGCRWRIWSRSRRLQRGPAGPGGGSARAAAGQLTGFCC